MCLQSSGKTSKSLICYQTTYNITIFESPYRKFQNWLYHVPQLKGKLTAAVIIGKSFFLTSVDTKEKCSHKKPIIPHQGNKEPRHHQDGSTHSSNCIIPDVITLEPKVFFVKAKLFQEATINQAWLFQLWITQQASLHFS